MSKKAKRKNAAEVVRTFTREDIAATMTELADLHATIVMTDAVVKAMRDKNMDEAHIEVVRKQVSAGMETRALYLNAKIRRVAVALFRSGTNMSQYVMDNLNRIPSVDDKMARTAFVQDVTAV